MRVIYIMIDSFNTPIFSDSLNSLRIDNTWTDPPENVTLQIWSEQVFAGLTALTSLTIQNIGMLQVFDKNILRKLNESLTTLTVTNISSPWNPGDFLGEVPMKTLSKVDLLGNNIRNVNKPMFVGIAGCVTSLGLQYSQIETIASDTFEDFTKLKTLYLQYNLIANIDHNVFTSLLLNAGSGFRINLQNNPLNCVCEMLPLKEMIQANSDFFTPNVKCGAPADWKGALLIDSDFCYFDTTTEKDETTLEETTEEETTSTEEPTSTTSTTTTVTTTTS